MPYIYEDTLQGESRNALTIPSSMRDVLGAQFQQSYEENPIMALKRFSDLAEAQVTGPRVSAQDARTVLQAAGMENDITVSDAGITRAALNTLIERKRVEKRRQEIFARSQGGFGEGAARFGVAVGATLSDPISFGLNFVPVVGQTRYARWLSTARSIGARMAVRGAVGAAEGAVGAAIAEVPIYAMRTQEQADYDMVDSLMNVAFGGVVGAGLHMTVGSVAELIGMPKRKAPRPEGLPPAIGERDRDGSEVTDAERIAAYPEVQRNVQRIALLRRAIAENMSSLDQQAALREAVAQAVEGQPINVEPVVAAGVAAAPPKADVPRVKIEGLASDQISISRNLADRLGVTADIERLAYEGRTAAEMVSSLGPRLDRVRELARANNEAPVAEARQFVREVRTSMGIPSLDDPREYQAWRQQYEVRRASQAPTVSRATAAPDASRSMPASIGSAADHEVRSAIEHAETTLAREVKSGTEAHLKAAEEEADLAVAEATELTKRLGVDMKEDADFAAVMEGVDKAERWARVAELATVCLVRGG